MDRKQIEDIYPLSPMQQGMLFDTLYLEGTGIYVERSAIQITGVLDIPTFERAWQKLVARHPILRTLFLWENRDTPLQIVRKTANLSLDCLDWRSEPLETHAAKLTQFLDNERQYEFDLRQAPLLRLRLIHAADDLHYLVMVFHHIILDRWSLGLLLNEVFALYQADLANEVLRLRPVRPFGDYIGWLQQQDAASLEAFWRDSLADFTSATPLNIETNRQLAEGESRYKQAETWLSEDSLARLSEFAREHRLTLNTIVQGAWALLLSHYSGETDVLFGATVAGRPAGFANVEQIVGLFINTLPIRVSVPDSVSLVAWLQNLQEQMSALQQVAHTPLVEVQQWSDVPAGSPLFESLIVFENIPVTLQSKESGLQLAGMGVRVRGEMAYPLTVTVNPEDRGRMWLQLTYEQSRFETEAVERLTAHLQQLLENISQQVDVEATSVSYFTPTEQEQLAAWRGLYEKTVVSPPLIHERIAQQAAQTPAALALTTISPPERPSFFLEAAQEMPQASLSYAELNKRANRLARHLVELGVGPEKVVAVHRLRSAETLVCLLAVLKAGGVFLPVDPGLPEQRLQHILADAKPVVVLTDDESGQYGGIPAFCPEQHADELAGYAVDELKRPLSPNNSAYLIYTSGTTGQPKGVLVSHGALLNHALAIVEQFALSPADRVLQFAALSFDVALEEIFPTWLAGAALLLRPLDVPSLDTFNQLLDRERISVINIPAPYWHEWVAEIERTPLFSVAQSLRLVVVGSDKVMAERVAQWHRLIPEHIRLLNGYGPTETTITATLYEATSMPDGLAVLPLGRPVKNVTAYVLAKNGRLAPIGAVGELCLGGAGLAHGYLNQSGQTAAAFVPNPFSEIPGDRLYRTGDLVRWLPDGTLAFVGRADHQVKIRGFRIELEEIENTLAQHSGIRQAVVVADEQNQRLLAYILLDDFSLSARSLQGWAERHLPEYMVPGNWMLLDGFPLTNSGKVDRQALPEPTFASDAETYVAPRREDEQTLTDIWGEVLGIEQIGIHDNFFQLGGHSLRATQIVSRIRQRLGWDVPVRAIFEVPTIAGLSARYAPEPILDDTAVLAELMDEVDGLSDGDLDDLAAMLDL